MSLTQERVAVPAQEDEHSLDFAVQGVNCAGCLGKIEVLFVAWKTVEQQQRRVLPNSGGGVHHGIERAVSRWNDKCCQSRRMYHVYRRIDRNRGVRRRCER